MLSPSVDGQSWPLGAEGQRLERIIELEGEIEVGGATCLAYGCTVLRRLHIKEKRLCNCVGNRRGKQMRSRRILRGGNLWSLLTCFPAGPEHSSDSPLLRDNSYSYLRESLAG